MIPAAAVAATAWLQLVASSSVPSPQPVRVTIVAPSDTADSVATALAPRLREIGMEPTFDRCEDFECVDPPGPTPPSAAIVVVGATRAMAIVPQGSTSAVAEIMTVAEPLRGIDLEGLGHAVVRGLVAPPSRLHSPWSDVEAKGRALAPVRRTAPPDTTPSPTPSGFGPGPYFTLGAGTATATGGVFQLGLAVRAGAGFLYAPRERSMLRVGIGARVSHSGAFGPRPSGLAVGEGRMTLGLDTGRLFPALRVGLGPTVAYGRYQGRASFGAAGTAALGLDARLRERFSVGLAAGMGFDFILKIPVLHATVGATWSWPGAGASGRRR